MLEKIKLERVPRFAGAPDERCMWYLIVGGYTIGAYYCGQKKPYTDKVAWAKDRIKKRLPVLSRNIVRLSEELEHLKNEEEFLSSLEEELKDYHA